jgi:hypothetical protein
MQKKNSTTHKELVQAGYKWLLSIGCSFALPELRTYAPEQPDVIGWKSAFSILIECKTSLSDFRADRKKPFRANETLGVGYYRFYLSSEHIIKPDVLPEKWGLLWLTKKGAIKRVVAPKGNVWTNWHCFPERNMQSEIQILCSAWRRVHQNKALETIFQN